MDPAVLQAAQRVMAWHLKHTVMPSPVTTPADDEDEAPDSEMPPPHGTAPAAASKPS